MRDDVRLAYGRLFNAIDRWFDDSKLTTKALTAAMSTQDVRVFDIMNRWDDDEQAFDMTVDYYHCEHDKVADLQRTFEFEYTAGEGYHHRANRGVINGRFEKCDGFTPARDMCNTAKLVVLPMFEVLAAPKCSCGQLKAECYRDAYGYVEALYDSAIADEQAVEQAQEEFQDRMWQEYGLSEVKELLPGPMFYGGDDERLTEACQVILQEDFTAWPCDGGTWMDYPWRGSDARRDEFVRCLLIQLEN